MTEVDLSWSPVTGATAYRVLRGAAKGGPYALLASPTVASYRDATLSAGTTVYYVVQTVKKRSVSANSAEVSATTIPAAPTALRAVLANPAPSSTTDRIDLAWSASTGATGYDVLRRASVDAPYAVVGASTTTTWSDAAVDAGRSYSYVVRARNAGGTSTNSASAGAVTRFLTSTTLTSSANPSGDGELVTFVAAVRGDGGNTRPSGSVAFQADVGTAPQNVALDGNGIATFTTKLPAGDHTVSAAYQGDTTYRGSSAGIAQQVRRATTTTITSSKNPATSGEPVTLTATVKEATGRGVPGLVDFHRGTQLIATVTLNAGVATVTVSDLPLGTSSLVAHYRGDRYFSESVSAVLSQVVEPAPTPYTLLRTPGLRLNSASVADLTGDGRQDVLVAGSAMGDEYGDGDWVLVYPQRADGTLDTPRPVATYAASTTPQRIATGDLDADGRSDAVHASDNGVTAYFGVAGTSAYFGSDGAALEQSTVTAQPTHDVAVADVDDDRASEIVAAVRDGGVWIYATSSGHEFDEPRMVTEAAHDLVAVGDLTGDGRADVVGHVPGAVTVYAQSSDGSFSPARAVTFPGTTHAFTLADVNADGKVDIVATGKDDTGKPGVFVVGQLSEGSLSRPMEHGSTDSPGPVAAGDLTGDGLVDVATAHHGSGLLSIYPQLGHYDGLAAPQVAEVPVSPSYDARGLVTGDVNGDQQTDVVLADPANGLVLLAQPAR